MRADLLAESVAGLDEVLTAVDAFDRALAGGLLRPQPAQTAGLTELADAVAGTPWPPGPPRRPGRRRPEPRARTTSSPWPPPAPPCSAPSTTRS